MNALKPHSEAWGHSLLQGDGLEGVRGLPPGPGGTGIWRGWKQKSALTFLRWPSEARP